MPQSMFSWRFLSVSWYFSIIRHMSREPDFSAKNRIFKKFLKCLKACLVGVFWVFQSILALFDIWAENRIFSREPDFQKFLKKPQNMFSWCFRSVSRYFSIVRNLCWEPHFWAENWNFKNFSKTLKTCFVGVFSVFQCIFLALFDIWAENRIFEPRTRFSRNSWKASKHV